MYLKGFKTEDFAKFHPSGSLGKKLTLTVKDLVNEDLIPGININSKFKDAIDEISSKMYGATAILENKKVVGIITDGDVRRTIKNFKDPLELDVSKIMSSQPKVIDSKTLASDALKIMNDNKITQIIVVEKDSYLGMVHMHQILNSGI